MRLARLAAVGLAIGVIAGFAIALLRPRPQDRTGAGPDPADDPGGSRPFPRSAGTSAALWANFQRAESVRTDQGEQTEAEAASPTEATAPAVLDVRATRRVTG